MILLKYHSRKVLFLCVGVFLAVTNVQQVNAFNVNSVTSHKSCDQCGHSTYIGASTNLFASTLPKDLVSNGKQIASYEEGTLPFVIESVSPRSKVQVFEEIASLCIDVFFNEEAEKKAEDRNKGKNSPWKEFLLAYLRNLQIGDLKIRQFEVNSGVASEMFVAREVLPLPDSSTNADENPIERKDIFNANSVKGYSNFKRGQILGYVDIAEKNFGFGEELEVELGGDIERKKRPVLTNLAVVAKARGSGVGSKLLEACETAVLGWRPPMATRDHSEIVLQVEESNINAQQFYEKRGYKILFADPSCRRLDSSGLLLRKVPTTKICFRKELKASRITEPFSGLKNLFFASFSN